MNDSVSEEIVDRIIIDTVVAVRNHRGEMNIPPSETLPLLIKAMDHHRLSQIEEHLPYIKRLARLGRVQIGIDKSKPKRSASVSTTYGELYIPLEENRLRMEVDRVEKRLEKVAQSLEAVDLKLSNPKFISNAPEAI